MLDERKRYTRREKPVEAARLFFGIAGDKNLGNTVKKLMDSLRGKYPEYGKLTATKVRERVIVHWLKNKDITTVQYMAGHKYVSSTEPLPTAQLEYLKEQVGQFHSLK